MRDHDFVDGDDNCMLVSDPDEIAAFEEAEAKWHEEWQRRHPGQHPIELDVTPETEPFEPTRPDEEELWTKLRRKK